MPMAKLMALITTLFVAGAAFTQQAGQTPPSAPPAVDCPPGVKGDPPTIGDGRTAESLSEKLAESRGIICPLAGIDPEMQKTLPRRVRSRSFGRPGRRAGIRRCSRSKLRGKL
jgi:hypothetical protein